MARPKKVKVGPFDIDIVEADLSVGDAFGAYSSIRQEILIHNDIAEQVIQETLLHEILHSIWFVSGAGTDKREEENIVRALTPHLLRFLRDNPGAVNYIIGRKP